MIAPVPMVSAKQITAIRTLQKSVRMDDDAYRAFLDGQAGVRSTKLLTASDAVRIIDALKGLAGQGKPPAKGAVAGLDTPVGRKLRALWIAGHDLGLVRERTDRAMLAFLERQTGVSHVKFLAPEHAYRAIEALKSWLARAAGVDWPAGDDAEVSELKRAVIDAQWARLAKVGAVKPLESESLADALDRYAFKVSWKQGWCFFEASDYAAVQSALGRKLRNVLARRDERSGA